MNYLDLIKQEIEQALVTLTPLGQGLKFSVEIPELAHGDVTTNVCLVASKVLGKSPKEVADILIPILEQSDFAKASSDKVEFKNPGFINFWLKKEFVRKGGKIKEEGLVENILKFFLGDRKENRYSGKKVLVEHTSVNLFKPFGIGHLMTNFVGEFVFRIFKEFGADAINMSYPSDISLGVAKAIYIIKKDGGLSQNFFKQSEKEIVTYLGECYRRGVSEYGEAEREVKDIANNLYGNIESEDLEIFEKCKKINLDYFANIVKSLNSHFEHFIFESEAGVEGKEIVLTNEKSGLFKRSEGAIIYEPSEERKDINTTVFINSEGNPTYAAKDIGLLSLKFKKFSPDVNIYVTDNEQAPHFRTVFDAASKINKDWSEKSIHITHGRMTFKGQKMSSRLGGVPGGEEVIETILEAVKSASAKATVDKGKIMLSDDELREIALSALRIAVLRAKPGVNIDFDPERALSFEGDSGPYLCYTSARLHSLLQKGKENNLFPGCQLAHVGTEEKLERKILQFENVLQTVVKEIAPQKLVTYLFELCGEFNHFYNETKIITDNKFESEHYLYVVEKTLNVLTKGLCLLGITAPERM